MSIADLVKDVVGVAHDLTKCEGLSISFTHEPVAATFTSSGTQVYGDSVTLYGVLSKKHSRVHAEDGSERSSSSSLTVMGSTEFDVRDKITVDGVVRPIIKIEAPTLQDGAPALSELFFT